jgi:hypothetical protein
MNTSLFCTLALCFLTAAPALGATPTGPGVYALPVAEALRLNGLRVELTHLQGPGLAALIENTRRQWMNAAGAYEYHRIGAWQILTRQAGTDSEVLQWRDDGPPQMAFYSRLDRQQLVTARPEFAWRLPEACRWQQTLESTQLRQRTVQGTAHCNGAQRSVLRQLQASLKRDGWLLSGNGEHYPLIWRKATLQLQVVLTDTHFAGQSRAAALVAVQTRNGAS